MPEAPSSMTLATTTNKRKPGRPQLNIRNSFAEALNKILPNLPQDCELKSWIPFLAQKNWSNSVKTWLSNIDSL